VTVNLDFKVTVLS